MQDMRKAEAPTFLNTMYTLGLAILASAPQRLARLVLLKALLKRQRLRQACADQPLTLITPTDPARRGSQVSYQHPEGFAVVQALIARGVIPDYREPRIMRFGFTPLYTRFVDVWDAVEHLRAVLADGQWREARFSQRGLVT